MTEPIESYGMRNLTADIVGLLDALGAEQAVLVGHGRRCPNAGGPGHVPVRTERAVGAPRPVNPAMWTVATPA